MSCLHGQVMSKPRKTQSGEIANQFHGQKNMLLFNDGITTLTHFGVGGGESAIYLTQVPLRVHGLHELSGMSQRVENLWFCPGPNQNNR